MCCKSSGKVVEMAITLQHHVASNRITQCYIYAVANLSVKNVHEDIRQLISHVTCITGCSHLYYFLKKSKVCGGLSHRFSLLKTVFITRVVGVEYVLAEVALEEYFSEHLNITLTNIIPPTLHTHLPYESDTSRPPQGHSTRGLGLIH
jgi:hypothetical protein